MGTLNAKAFFLPRYAFTYFIPIGCRQMSQTFTATKKFSNLIYYISPLPPYLPVSLMYTAILVAI